MVKPKQRDPYKAKGTTKQAAGSDKPKADPKPVKASDLKKPKPKFDPYASPKKVRDLK